MFRTSRREHTGFTLVELLVVIGIIAVLISILLPSLARARRAANNVACLSNLRQIMMATQMYGQENRDSLPWCVYQGYHYKGPSDPATDDRYWYHFISPYMGQTDAVSAENGNEYGLRQVSKAIDGGCKEFDALSNPRWTGYGMNYYINPDVRDPQLGWNWPVIPNWSFTTPVYAGFRWNGSDPVAPVKFARLKQNQQWVFADSVQAFMYPWSPTVGWAMPWMMGGQNLDNPLLRDEPVGSSGEWWDAPSAAPSRHDGKANYVFADGHAESLTKWEAMQSFMLH